MTATTLLCFLGASIALTVAPGPDNLFIIAQGITQGRRAAILTALGMCSGVSVHTLAAALGLSAIFHSSALAFEFLKILGAAYLFFLAWRSFRAGATDGPGEAPRLSSRELFRRGFLMNVLNPKVALFFLAFLPQFVSSEAGSIPLQMVILGLLFMLQAVVLFCTLGYFAGGAGRLLLSHPAVAPLLGKLTGCIFLALGLRLLLVRR